MDDIKKAMLLKLKNQENDAGEKLMSDIKEVGRGIDGDKAARLEDELSYTPVEHYPDRPTTGLDVELTKRDPGFFSSTQERYNKTTNPEASTAWTGGNDPSVKERWTKLRKLNSLRREEPPEMMSKMEPGQKKELNMSKMGEDQINSVFKGAKDKWNREYESSPEYIAKRDRRQELMDRKIDALREASDEELEMTPEEHKRMAARLARFSDYGK
jgi:hypothetical protein